MDSVITDIFQGQFYNSTRCQTCGYNNISFSDFSAINLSLPKEAVYSSHSISLEDCLHEYTKPELVDKSGYHCAQCKVLVSIKKQTTICRLPSVLIIHLERYYCTDWKKDKLDTRIDYPIHDLDMKPYCINSSKLYL
jgi:ubiquitin C-terminal hydrolase